ncbi:hypothetical protein N7530_009144 [Penicillium desertorum]|uniref:Uncharacterized protein n=1 Tax=Penicillium desertorum TaxID=1303715 RepID=A0A9X0BLZ1_9EURO|nr:hypothetical protein N7530_009144 [Penicillium desertorum]
MLDKVQKQSETFESYCANAMEEPSEEDSVPNSSSGELKMDGIDMEMRPRTPWDPPGPQNGDT